jgi:hypothetical protein
MATGRLESFPEVAQTPIAQCMVSEIVTRPLSANTREVCEQMHLLSASVACFALGSHLVVFQMHLSFPGRGGVVVVGGGGLRKGDG